MPKSHARRGKPPRPKSVQQGRVVQQRRQERAASVPAQSRNDRNDYQQWLFEERAANAEREAVERLPKLFELAMEHTADDFEDALCAYLGSWMFSSEELQELDPAEYFDPDHVLAAVAKVAAGTALYAAGSRAYDVDVVRAAWLVLDTLGRIASEPYDVEIRRAIEVVRKQSGSEWQPTAASATAPIGPALWTRDAYGSRFAITAPFMSQAGTERWYLWDVDGCSGWMLTLSSGYFADADAALASWKAQVGQTAAGDCTFAPIDDRDVLAQVLPKEQGLFRIGGESEQQFAEYHRSKRLAAEVLAAIPPDGHGTRTDAPTQRDATPSDATQPEPTQLDPVHCVELFTKWRAEHRPDAPHVPDFDTVVGSLARDWLFVGVPALQRACSPHRVALFAAENAAHERNLLPDWVAWFTEFIGLPEHLADRCMRDAVREAYSPYIDVMDCVEE